jgi:hypothetical protein
VRSSLTVDAPDATEFGADAQPSAAVGDDAQHSSRVGPAALLAVLGVALTLVWILWAARASGTWNLVVLIGALACHGLLLLHAGPSAAAGRPDRIMPVRAAMWLSGVALLLVALAPLHHSRDLYLYDIYGRAVAEHAANPYVTTPAQLTDDPVLGFVSKTWHQQQSMYGPAFVAGAALVSTVAGTSELTIRLVWQLVMAGAAFAAVVLVARRTRDPVAVLALGCSPVVLLCVNDAHNDVLLGLGLLAVVLLVERRQHRWAGVAAACVLGIKLTVALPVLAVAWWVWRRRGLRPVLELLGTAAVIVTTGYLLVGVRAAMVPLRDSSGDDSRFALWQPWRDRDVEHLLSEGVRRREVLEVVRDQMSTYALVALVLCVLVVWWRYRHAKAAGEGATITTVVLLLTATYVMPWYPAMILPVAVLTWRSRASILAFVQGAFLVVAYAQAPGTDPTTGFGQLLEQRAVWINLAMLAVALVWAAPSVRSTARASRAISARISSGAGADG